jgi:hypothetical protein
MYINTDALAESHYSSCDPAFSTEEDLNEQKERMEEETVFYIENMIAALIDNLTDSELSVAKEKADYFAEYLQEKLEDLD